MSDPDPNDDQAIAEALDEDALDDDAFADFPPEHRIGLERQMPETVPDELPPADEPVTGLLEPDDDADEEVAELGDPEFRPSAEEAAVHETAPPPAHEDDGYLDE